MQKLGLIVKDTSARIIRDNIKNSSSFFIIKYSGLSSPDLTALRKTLRGINSNLLVVRNKIAIRVLTELGRDELKELIDGTCGFIFIKEEPVNASKVVCNFLKEHEKLIIEGGLFGDKVLAKADITALSKVPSKEALRAQVVMCLNSPLSGLAMVLNGTLRKFVYCMDQIRVKRGG